MDFLSVFIKGNIGNEVIERVSTEAGDDNDTNSKPYFGLYEQLCQSHSLRFPQ